MPPPRRSREQLEAELLLLRNRRLSDGWASVANNFVKWGALAGIAYFLYLCVDAVAGRETTAKLVVAVISDFKLHIALPWFLTAVAVILGLLQRHLKNGTVDRLGRRIKELEERLDPGRTSSRLTSRGGTNPEDRL
jgi:hypothetical protein